MLGRPELDFELAGNAGEAVAGVQPDVIINTAAFTAVDDTEDEPARAYRINADGAGEMARAARACGASLIQISTDYVFDGRSSAPYRPGDGTGPLNVYGRSKLEGEEQVRAALPEHLILRTAWLLSPFGANFLVKMLRLAEQQEVVRIVSDQRGSPTSTFDVADGLFAILRCWREDRSRGLGETYHLAGCGAASWAELAVAIFDEAGAHGLPTARVEPISSSERPSRAERPTQSSLDSTDFRAHFAHADKPWRTGVRDVVAALAEQARDAALTSQDNRSTAMPGPT